MFPGEITRIALRWAPQDIAAAGSQAPGTDYVLVRSDQRAGLRRALPHPRPRGQRVHAAAADRQVIVALRLLLLAVAAAALAAALAIGVRGRGDDHAAVRYACPMHPEVRAAAPRRMPDLSDGARAGGPAAAARGTAADSADFAAVENVRRHNIIDFVRRRSLLVPDRELRAPASVCPDGTVSALFYDDEIAALGANETGTFAPTAAPQLSFRVRREPGAVERWDRSTSRIRFRFTPGGAGKVSPRRLAVGWVKLAPRPRAVLAVPASAIVQSPEGPYVLAWTGVDFSFEKRPIEIGETFLKQGFAVVLSGLRAERTGGGRAHVLPGGRSTLRQSRAIETGSEQPHDRAPGRLVRAPPSDRHCGARWRAAVGGDLARRRLVARRDSGPADPQIGVIGRLDGPPGAGGRGEGDARADRGARRRPRRQGGPRHDDDRDGLRRRDVRRGRRWLDAARTEIVGPRRRRTSGSAAERAHSRRAGRLEHRVGLRVRADRSGAWSRRCSTCGGSRTTCCSPALGAIPGVAEVASVGGELQRGARRRQAARCCASTASPSPT